MIEIYHQSLQSENIVTISHATSVFADIGGQITLDMIREKQKYVLNNEMKAFLRVRCGQPQVQRGRLTYRDIPSNKPEVLSKLMEVINTPVQDRFYALAPVEPVEQE